MEENKLFNEIKSAAENAETKDFPAMEKVWQRVEEKLDKKEDKKAIWRWKKIAVAASLLLFGTLGYQFLKNNPEDIKPSETVTITDSIKKIHPLNNDIVTAEPVHPAIKKDAEEILQKQIVTSQIALEESPKANYLSDSILAGQKAYLSAPAATQGSYDLKYDSETETKTKAKTEASKDVELFMDKSGKVSNERKEEPLVVIEEKVSKKSLKNLQFDDTDSLVVLNEPLYIINGVEYTEQEVFGPNPTSPYTPLNQQEIETISVLQNEKAIEIYGDKGKKGVVIITTKNGKPVSASKKAK
jgi:hypothetical protein